MSEVTMVIIQKYWLNKLKIIFPYYPSEPDLLLAVSKQLLKF